jgi:wyosine [tRNA(Phe)-imidazoG37] synthetase (radical SAM superfamily)
LTFSGNGEPTLHPYFSEVAYAVHRVRAGFAARNVGAKRPEITLFSNASRLAAPEVQRGLQYIDLPILKLDAGDPITFERIARPAEGVIFAEICQNLRRVPNLVIQSVFVGGDVTNVTPTAFDRWLERLSEIGPAAVQIYSIDYPVPDQRVQRVPAYVLLRLAEEAEARLGVPVTPYWID